MSFTSAIEQRLDHIQQDVAHSFNPDHGSIQMSAADVHWLLLLARNASKRKPMLSHKQLKVARIIFYLFLGCLGTLSITGIIWGIAAIFKLV